MIYPSYFRMTSTPKSGAGTVINYSSRFTVSGLTGTTPATALAAVPGGTSGPATENTIVAGGNVAGDAAAVDPAAGAYGTPFNEQSGSIKYAPMQPFPPTKITKKGKPTPQFPTSAFNIATTRMAPPTVISTITQSQTFTAMTMENTVRLLRGVRTLLESSCADSMCRSRLNLIPKTTWPNSWPGGRTEHVSDASVFDRGANASIYEQAFPNRSLHRQAFRSRRTRSCWIMISASGRHDRRFVTSETSWDCYTACIFR